MFSYFYFIYYANNGLDVKNKVFNYIPFYNYSLYYILILELDSLYISKFYLNINIASVINNFNNEIVVLPVPLLPIKIVSPS